VRERDPRVFVVDDNHSSVRSVSNLLESDGYEVEFFLSSREYSARKPHLGPACLILDVFLPGP
jgi:FixJ family two-component response regulator